MIFEDNVNYKEFKIMLIRMCNYKLYIETNIRKNQHIDAKMAMFLVDPRKKRESIVFDGMILKEPKKMEVFTVYIKNNFNYLKELKLNSCHIDDNSCKQLISQLL